MVTREMHYDFKRKFNKIDSQKNRNLLVPEIDWYLNEAAELFVKKVAEPKTYNGLGFETSQRITDDIKTIVKHRQILTPDGNNIITLPPDYLYFIRGRVVMSKGNCTGKKGVLVIREHSDLFEEQPFYKSSFEWRTVNGLFTELGLELFTDDSFTIDSIELSYIRKMVFFHNAQDFNTGSYRHLGTQQLLTGTVQCELPEHTHREIVDIAVQLASSEVPTSDLQIKMSKLNYNQII